MKTIFFIALLLLVSCDNALKPNHSLKVAAKGLHAAALSNNGEHAFVGSIYHGGSFWQTHSQERLFNWNHSTEPATTIIAADFSSTNNWVLTADVSTLVLWNAQSGKSERYWAAPGEILDIELGPNASTAILGMADHNAVMFNVRAGGIQRVFKHGNRVRSVDLSQDGRLALTGSEDYFATLWDVQSGEALVKLKHNDDVQLVALADDGSLALSVSKYDKALLWEAPSGDVRGELPIKKEHIKRGVRYTAAEFNKDNSLLLTGRPDQRVDLWDTVTLEHKARWRIPKVDQWKPTSAAILAVAFGENEHEFYAVSSNGFIHKLTLDEAHLN